MSGFRRQINALFEIVKRTPCLDILKSDTNVTASFRDNRLITVMFVSHIRKSTGMIARTIHVPIKLFLQVPVVTKIANHQPTYFIAQVEEVNQTSTQARGEHCEELIVLENQLLFSIVIHVDKLGVSESIPLPKPPGG